MTDLRKLLVEARETMLALVRVKPVRDLDERISCIDAALAEKVEPVATWGMVHTAVKQAIEKCKDASGMRNSIDTYVNATQITHDVMGTDTVLAPADQWRRVEDKQPGTPITLTIETLDAWIAVAHDESLQPRDRLQRLAARISQIKANELAQPLPALPEGE